jgi:serine/threonine protein kinase
MEYCDGGNLWDVLRQRPESIDFLNMATQFACGMRYVHDTARMLHRDLKTPNLLLTKAGQVGTKRRGYCAFI